MKTHFLSCLGLVLALGYAEAASDPVVARVNGKKEVHLSDVDKARKQLPNEGQGIPDDKVFPILRDQQVDQYLIEQAVSNAEADILKEADVKTALEELRKKFIQQVFLSKKIEKVVTDAAVKKKFDEYVANFPKDKEAKVSHILVKDEATAKSIIKALKNGGDFAKIAKEKSIDESGKKGGDIDYVAKGDIPQALADAIFELKSGQYGEKPVKTDFGWHVVKVHDLRDRKPPTFDEAKQAIKEALAQEELMKYIKDLRSSAKIEKFDKEGKPEKQEEAKPEDKAPKAEEKKPEPAAK